MYLLNSAAMLAVESALRFFQEACKEVWHLSFACNTTSSTSYANTNCEVGIEWVEDAAWVWDKQRSGYITSPLTGPEEGGAA